MKKPRYYILTWDCDRQDFTPQKGVRTGPYSLFRLRKALRTLREYGYSARRDDPSVLVERRGPPDDRPLLSPKLTAELEAFLAEPNDEELEAMQRLEMGI